MQAHGGHVFTDGNLFMLSVMWIGSFLDMTDSRGKGYSSPGRANGQSPSSGSQSPVVPPIRDSADSSPGIPQSPVPTQVQQSPPSSSTSSLPEPSSAAASPPPPPDLQAPEQTTPFPSLSTAPPTPTAAPPPKRGIISRLFGSSPVPEPPAAKPGEPGGCYSWLAPKLLNANSNV